MERARELREYAARCLRVSRNVNVPADVAWLEALAAQATQAVEWIETKEAADGAAWPPAYPLAEEPRGMAPADSDMILNRGAVLERHTLPDRRRAGSQDDASPVLIPLLREDGIASLSGTPANEGTDDLNATRGIIIWALISAAMWLVLAWWIAGRGR
jgi:hypothetical protein